MKHAKNAVLLALFLFGLFLTPLGSADESLPSVLGLREQARLVDGWLKIRLQTVLPEVMRREKLNMWVVIALEQDAVFTTNGTYFLAGRQTKMRIIK